MVLSEILDYLDPDFWLGKDLEHKIEDKIKPSKITKLKCIPCMAIGYTLCVVLRLPPDYQTFDGKTTENIYSSLFEKGYSKEQIDSAFSDLNLQKRTNP